MAKELLPLEGATSAVWNHFGFPSHQGKITVEKKKREFVHCKLCPQVLRYSGSTTNMRYHLEEHHRKVFDSLPKSTASSSKRDKDQPTLQSIVSASQPIQPSSATWNRLTDGIMYFIAKDMQPLDTIDDKGFRHMIKVFEPRYNPLSRKTLSSKLLPQLYESELARVKTLTRNGKFYALTTDIWTSRANHAYTGVTIHFLSQSSELHHFLLEAREFPSAHSGANIADEMTEVLKEWDISIGKITAITTDNGANITLAIEILEMIQIPCFSHTLQLGVERVLKLPVVVKAVARCKRIVTHFHHSSKSTYLLKENQTSLCHKTHSLVQDVATRWNSTYYMITRIIEQQQPICAKLLAIRKGELMPTDSEFATLEAFISVMKPLVEITEAIGGEKWITISTIRPILHKLLKSSFVPSSDDSAQVKSFKKVLLTDLQDRYTGDVLMFLSKATMLDPRFKGLKFLTREERDDVVSHVREDAAFVDPVSDTELEQPSAKRSKGEGKLMHILEGIGEVNDEAPSKEEQLDCELSRFLGEQPTTDSPTEWWSNNHGRYPLLSQLARRYLAVPATSVPCERAFSTAGHIASEKRSCLLPENVNRLVFLAENLP